MLDVYRAGNWYCLAAQYDAKSVDGFDIQPEMVELAKQATSHLQDMVHIRTSWRCCRYAL